MNPQYFFDFIKKEIPPDTKFPLSILLAQAALETGYGKHAPYNNYFGIKATKNESQFYAHTEEFQNGKSVSILSAFRRYASLKESIQDYLTLMKHSRYEKIWFSRDYKEACIALQQSGYATDPLYGEKIKKIIERYELLRYENPPHKPEFAMSREFVVNHKISDGKRPSHYASREEVWEMLYRLASVWGLEKK